MKILRLITALCLFTGLSLISYAQIRIVPKDVLESVNSPRLSCDSALLGFNTRRIVAPKMNEEDAPSVYVYEMANLGTDRLEVKALRTTCSCVRATAGRMMLEPGENTEISVRYDPKGHPGRFERRIFVYTREGNDPAAVLTLSVNVEAGADMSGEWPVQMGGIRMRRSAVEFTEDRRAVEKLRFINVGNKPLMLECEKAFLPECLSFEVRPQMVPAGQEGEIVITYDPQAGQARENMKVILKGLGLPPSKSSITIRMRLRDSVDLPLSFSAPFVISSEVEKLTNQ